MNVKSNKIKTIRLVLWVLVILFCIYSAYSTYNKYSKSQLLKFENKNVEINGAIGVSRFGYLYRSLNIMKDESVPLIYTVSPSYQKPNSNYSYKDSINTSRPLLIDAFRWTKFPSIHKYIFLKHNDIKNAKYLYFYHYKSHTRNEIYGLTANEKPSKVYFFLDVLSDITGFLFCLTIILIWISEWVLKKTRIIASDIDILTGDLYIIMGILLVIGAII